MKLILSGSTGLIGREVIRQALLNPRITTLIALTRRPIDVAAIADTISSAERGGIDPAKVKSVVLQDFEKYPDDVKKELADADGCIWSLALTPLRSKQHPWEEVIRICKGYCTAGMKAILDARRAAGKTGEFRFVYVSGHGISRDMTQKPWILVDYQLMRGGMENTVLDFAAEHKESGWKACIAKPGLISGLPGVFGMFRNAAITAVGWVGNTISAEQCARAMIKQCVDGIDKETLVNWDMVKLGRGDKI
ncbi:hypothetical protein P280DRAFT_554811 [Massarina eburnea CBS 473.64]|uniref:Uncharacterized protein n=1 Tax=Massarina eburnea CBS 473.64 TaxID=1395130 RepID=A0A6A6RFB4_9PLEO|nr:hypothetical protein P280DRAFT_554811 [Massarina eburnea CBS 473.64]